MSVSLMSLAPLLHVVHSTAVPVHAWVSTSADSAGQGVPPPVANFTMLRARACVPVALHGDGRSQDDHSEKDPTSQFCSGCGVTEADSERDADGDVEMDAVALLVWHHQQRTDAAVQW
jgi:hypothetical protein